VILRFVAYFVLAGLAAFAASAILPTPQIAIIAFAVFVLLLALAMPALGFDLSTLAVDTLYYAAAGLAAVMYFLAAEPDQKLVALQTTLSEDNANVNQTEAEISAVQSELGALNQKIDPSAQHVQELEKELGENWVHSLVETDDPNSKSVIDAVDQAEAFAFRVSAEAEQCDQTLELLGLARAFRQLDDKPQDNVQLPDFAAELREQEYQREMNRCSLVSVLQSRIDALGTGPERAAGLLDLSRDENLTSALIGYSQPSATLSEADLPKVASLYRLRTLRSSYEGALRELATLKETAENLSNRISTQSANVETLKTKIENTQQAIEDTKDHLEGLALRAKNWMTLRWPFFLIAFLGMKLARKPLFLLK
jgi:septal ring factor EnvC (AmiA/AmiB activator)